MEIGAGSWQLETNKLGLPYLSQMVPVPAASTNESLCFQSSSLCLPMLLMDSELTILSLFQLQARRQKLDSSIFKEASF